MLFRVLIIFLISISSSFAGNNWDVESEDPPPTSNLKPLPRPTEIKPFTFLFYQECKSKDGMVQYTGKYSFTIFSQYRTAAFDCEIGDTLVVMKIRSMNQGVRQKAVYYPQKPFTLLVIICPEFTVPDTAVFKIDIVAGTHEYLKQSKLVNTETPKELPDNFVFMQLLDRSDDRAKDFLKQAYQQFGSAIEQIVLNEGFYPCSPATVVERTNVGRRKVLNETAHGFLVGLQVTDQSQAAAISQWIGERQLEEFKRFSNQLRIKGR